MMLLTNFERNGSYMMVFRRRHPDLFALFLFILLLSPGCGGGGDSATTDPEGNNGWGLLDHRRQRRPERIRESERPGHQCLVRMGDRSGIGRIHSHHIPTARVGDGRQYGIPEDYRVEFRDDLLFPRRGIQLGGHDEGIDHQLCNGLAERPAHCADILPRIIFQSRR